jgi:sugar/nucleoside kinase (ribokinase family)
MARDLDVVVVCEINVDVVVTGLDGPPQFGAERAVSGVTLTAGGSGMITATGLADLGLRAGVCGMAGDDPFGHFMLDHCAHHAIDTTGVVLDGAEQTGASVLLSTNIDRAILTHLGAMARFSLPQVRLDVLARARHLHVSSHFLQRALQPDVPTLLAKAHAMGLTTSADTGHDPEEQWQIQGLLEQLDLFMPNEVEARAISGRSTVEAALDWLAARVPTAVVKCGAAGAWAAQGDRRLFVPGFAVEAIDLTGAGDAFDAGFLRCWLAQLDLTASLRYANACGALTAAHIGGTGALDTARVTALLQTAAPTD